jgi:hypothetical protein
MNIQHRAVRTLIGHRQIDVGLICLASLLKKSAESLRLAIHDDGTLTPEDCDRLSAAFPGSVVISRPEADESVQPLLSRYPQCSAYRRRHPLALKLIDLALVGDGDLAYCDTDVLFLKRFSHLFDWPDSATSAVFMQDGQEAYSLRPWHMFPFGKIRVPGRINSGLILFRTANYDLEFVEWLLARPELKRVFRKRPYWIEQTCWAALAWRVGCRVWRPEQFMLANSKMLGVSPETVGIHFVAAYRSKLQDFLACQSVEDGQAAVEIRSVPARPASHLRMVVDDLKRRL